MCYWGAPWSVSDTLSFGFAAYNGVDCGTCFQIQFTGKGQYNDKDPGSVAINGKTMIVQVINIGGIAANQFDLLILVGEWVRTTRAPVVQRNGAAPTSATQMGECSRPARTADRAFSRCARPRSATCRSSWQAAIGSTAGSLRPTIPRWCTRRLPARPRSAPSRESSSNRRRRRFTTRHAQYRNEMPAEACPRLRPARSKAYGFSPSYDAVMILLVSPIALVEICKADFERRRSKLGALIALGEAFVEAGILLWQHMVCARYHCCRDN